MLAMHSMVLLIGLTMSQLDGIIVNNEII
jgi:hypothetical protein